MDGIVGRFEIPQRSHDDLREADGEARRSLEGWMERFAGYVRAVDPHAAEPMFHPRIVAFGTHGDLLPSLDAWIEGQWAHVWPHTSGFRFDLDRTRMLISAAGDLAVVIAPWDSTGYHLDQTRFERPGRATMVLRRDRDEWLCIHSHMSLNKDVPQRSHRVRAT